MANKSMLVFGASNSRQSINKQLAVFAANQLTDVQLEIVDLNDFPLPIYSKDDEKETGVPENAKLFATLIEKCDGIVASFPEHNGLFTVVFKNLWDWMSRLDTAKIWREKPMFLLSTSPSRREEKYVMKVAKDLFPVFGGVIVSEYYLRSFHQTYREGQIQVPELARDFERELNKFQSYIDNL
ncbi:MAG: NAD(P)H-dependent oxidoreductase [Bacteroidota bacterium]